MSDQSSEAVCEQIGELIEQHLDHLHRGGPPVDLNALPPEIAAQTEPLLAIVDLLTDLGPPSPVATHRVPHNIKAVRCRDRHHAYLTTTRSPQNMSEHVGLVL